MRPDAVAFRELDTLVRNLSEQLAGYRRRALAAESRSRELEQETSALEFKLRAAEAAHRELAQQQGASSDANASDDSRVSTVAGGDGERQASELANENERLRARLSDARERTALVADRVRFLRQQLAANGAER